MSFLRKNVCFDIFLKNWYLVSELFDKRDDIFSYRFGDEYFLEIIQYYVVSENNNIKLIFYFILELN